MWLIILTMIISVIYVFYKNLRHQILNGIYQFFVEAGIQDQIDFRVNEGTNKEDFLLDVYQRGNLALGEGYMHGKWDCPNLYQFFKKILRHPLYELYKYGNPIKKLIKYFIYSQTSSLDMIKTHYELGNDFYSQWLGENMQYSCGYWKDSIKCLNDAQIAKMDLIARKLQLKPGMHILDVGCGWGTLAIYLSKYFGVKVTAINLSSEMLEFANERLKAEKSLNSLTNTNIDVEYVLGDFSEIVKKGEKYDRIVSVGFYEHVTNDRYNEFYKVMNSVLVDDGIMLLHTIGANIGNDAVDPWINKYIFTRGQIPNLQNITLHSQANNFVIEDLHNFGGDYAKTLLSWLDNFNKCDDKLKKDPIFYRMWVYYLSSCAAAFDERELYLWQFIFTKKSNKNVYVGCR